MHPRDFAETSRDDLAEGLQTKAQRRPRIAIMGEFSAGKSTLSNLLIGMPILPVKVTATQLPPVWISYGNAEPYLVDLEGCESPVDLTDLSGISPKTTQYIRAFRKSDTLDLCDLIDMPGISDPNMPAEVWERVSHHADAAIWCTHATQAWRQSEAAVWSTFSPELYGKSLLLLTRFDKIEDERDRQRVVARVKRETEGLFCGVFPISLTRALEAGDDLELWKSSGADAFAMALIEIACGFSDRSNPSAIPEEPAMIEAPDCVRVLSKERPPAPLPDRGDFVMPTRVVCGTRSSARAERPPRSDIQHPYFGTSSS